jgi:hypothetical protein
MEQGRHRAALALPAAAVLFLVWGPIVGATYDDEEYRSAILTLVVHARALLDGVYPYWTSSLGFGLPHPLHPALLIHPLLPLFGVLAPDNAARVLYAAHAALGAAGCWWLVRYLGGGPWAAALASATWTLSAPSANYVLTDFWPVEFVVWSLAPYLLLAALRVLESPSGGRRWIDAIAFGLVAGLMWANGHGGHVPVYFVPLAFMFAVHWRRTARLAAPLVLAVGVAVAVAGPTLAALLSEIPRFPDLPRYTARVPVGWAELTDMVLRPLTFSSNGMRVPFFGGPMLVCALFCVLGVTTGSPHRRSLTAGFLSAGALMLVPALERSGVVLSSAYLFRDPMVLYGIALGALAWQLVLNRWSHVAVAAAVLQVAVLTIVIWPFMTLTLGARPIINSFLHNQTTAASLGAWTSRLPGRWYVAPELETKILERRVVADGLWLNMWLYSGLPVVNGTFKGVSADEMYPSEYLAIGRILGHRSTVTSPATLDVLGIGAILATAGEPVAPSLEEVARFPTHGAGDLRLLRNPDAWPGAAFVEESALHATPAELPACTIGGVLCLDLTPLTAAAHDTGVRVQRIHGAIDFQFSNEAVTPRWLLVAEMHRPAWTARAGDAELPVFRVLGGLIAVRVPAGVGAVSLRYRPTFRILLTWLSGVATVGAVMILIAAAVNRGRAANSYLHRMLSRYVGYHLPPDARIAELSPRSSLLIESLGRPSARIALPVPDAGPPPVPVLNGWNELRSFQPDRIILNGTLHFERDIQGMLDQLRVVCTTNTRVIIAYYSSLWRPALVLAWRFGLTSKGPDHNWVTPSDVSNLLRLTGFELITESQHILLPVHIPLISGFVNRWLAPLPILRWFALVNLALVRVAPSPAAALLSVSIVVPARNERGNIASIVERVPQMGPDDEIIFVEGHSSDGTWDEIQAVVARHPDRRLRALRQPGRGKGDAVRAGFAAASGDVLMILDADLTVAPEDLPKFYAALTSGLGEFINGSRLIYPMEREAMRFANMVGNKFFALAFTYLLGQPLKDTLCGTKVLSRRHYEQIAAGRMYFGDFDPFGDFDLLFGAAKLGLRVVELPVRYRERTYGSTNIRRWVHGWLLLRMTAFAARKIRFI